MPTWDQVVSSEGGCGKQFFNKIEDTYETRTYARKWFASGQAWYEFYSLPEYVYSLLFGWHVVSKGTYRGIGKQLVDEKVIDVGGSIFTAYELASVGVSRIYLTNFEDSPQLDFARYMIEKEEPPIEIVPNDSVPKETTMICSEYLEHFRYVDAELDRLMEFRPPAIYDRSSFCMVAYGHFIPINVGGVDHTDSRMAKRALVKEMDLRGYTRFKVPIYNRNPNLFVRR